MAPGAISVAPAPEQHVMVSCPESLGVAQPKIPGNGCPCRCCGAPPQQISLEKLKKNGNDCVRWVQKADGRVIEYYVYGAQENYTSVFLQIHGSQASAKMFSEIPPLAEILKEKNVKAIAINCPGHGFTSADPLRRIGDWAASDVVPVLAAESVPEAMPLLVEGTSAGSLHCFSVLHHFQDRITHVHLHVPALPNEVAKELELKPVSEGLGCEASYVTTCFLVPCHWCSPVLFCCCSCMAPSAPGNANAIAKAVPNWDTITGYDAVHAVKEHSMKHMFANDMHGPFVYGSFLGQLLQKWGFHPFKDVSAEKVERMKIMVSYGEKDTSCPEAHGEQIAKHYSEKCNEGGKLFVNVDPKDVIGNDKGGKCLVNKAPGGHVAHFAALFKGDLLRKLLEL